MKLTEAPSAFVVAVATAGLVLVSLAHWRQGAVVIGVAMLVGAGLRLLLPSRRAGSLVVRSRPFDTGLLLFLGLAMIALAISIPTGQGA